MTLPTSSSHKHNKPKRKDAPYSSDVYNKVRRLDALSTTATPRINAQQRSNLEHQTPLLPSTDDGAKTPNNVTGIGNTPPTESSVPSVTLTERSEEANEHAVSNDTANAPPTKSSIPSITLTEHSETTNEHAGCVDNIPAVVTQSQH